MAMGALETLEAKIDAILERLASSAPAEGSDGRWLRTEAAAEHIGVSVPTLRRWVARGEIPAVRMSRTAIAFDRRDLDQWMLERKA